MLLSSHTHSSADILPLECVRTVELRSARPEVATPDETVAGRRAATAALSDAVRASTTGVRHQNDCVRCADAVAGCVVVCIKFQVLAYVVHCV